MSGRGTFIIETSGSNGRRLAIVVLGQEAVGGRKGAKPLGSPTEISVE